MYSQRDEEAHILKACEQSVVRKLLDIGAWHPTDKSNSRALIEAGWGATLVEPSPAPLRALVAAYAERADIDVISGAVAVHEGPLQLQVTDDAVSAPAGSEQVARWRGTVNYIGRLWVHAYTIADLLTAFGPFDFVNIDTEGSSVDLLKVLLATEMFPKCICVEHDGRILEALRAARDRGYQSIYESEENLIFGR